MVIPLFFLMGILTGYFLEVNVNNYRDQKLARLEEVLDLEKADEWEYFEDHLKQVWAIKPGMCERVF